MNVRPKFVAALGIALILAIMLLLPGCAALPMEMQPKEQSSAYAEGAWLVLDTIDTIQTSHIRKGTSCDHEADPVARALYGSQYPKPGRVILTNVALMAVHMLVTSWLDDHVEAEDAKNKAGEDNTLGPWYVTRVVWHGVSLVGTGASVISNHSRGCRP